jgi:hypothetical protein
MGIAVIGTATLPITAHASGYAPNGYYTVQVGSGCLRDRSQPNTSGNILACIPNGTSIYLECQVTGETVNGDPIWDRARDYGGWVSDNYMSTPFWQTQTLQPCPASSYQMNVLVIKYFPLVSGTQNLDSQETQVSCPNGQISNTTDTNHPCTLTFMKNYVAGITGGLTSDLTSGSAYHLYSNPTAPPSLNYSVVATLENDSKVPREPDNNQVPYYQKILSDANICNYILQHGVNEVWIFAYQSQYMNQISESLMAGPNGEVANGSVSSKYPLPVCLHTYTVYTFNYGRALAEAMESHSHQLEAELNSASSTLFGQVFENNQCPHPGDPSDQTCFLAQSQCGSVHNPPNAAFEHDYGDTNAHTSDCPNFGTTETLVGVSCQDWKSCTGNMDTNEPHYLMWWMQNFPGLGNQATYLGFAMRNWWDAHGDWDLWVWSGGSLFK